ncbi:flavonol sulfotransferase-like [Herrania umbratica]|uniref:Sulfotransferase n=1 Tax=Herrania umbratica TaxID=108875 RepID=A0A6J1AWH3_9ROSI|nr:flavonol sulfotransferase-like [Herrania umbratica]
MEFSSPFQTNLAANISAESQEEYRKIISTLPKETAWTPMQPLCLYQGFWFFPIFLEGAMYIQDHFQAQSTDVLLCSSVKTGTVWLKALCFSIATRTQFNNYTSPLQTTFTHQCIPFLDYGEYAASQGPRFPLLATHMPYTCLPKSVIDSGCKIVYLCRDPKDNFVSLWHFLRKVTRNSFKELKEGDLISVEEAFELFCKGISFYGPYWEHVLGYWNASLEHPERILFLKYEDMMKETAPYAKKIAEFLGCPFSSEEERGGRIQEIIEFCSFENLSNLEVNKAGLHQKKDKLIENSAYFRKGKVGDWRNYLTTEMGERLDNIMEQKLSGSGLIFRVSPQD